MSVTVNDDCIGCGTCEGIAPDAFEMVDGVAVAKADADANSTEVEEAIEACPVSAISK